MSKRNPNALNSYPAFIKTMFDRTAIEAIKPVSPSSPFKPRINLVESSEKDVKHIRLRIYSYLRSHLAHHSDLREIMAKDKEHRAQLELNILMLDEEINRNNCVREFYSFKIEETDEIGKFRLYAEDKNIKFAGMMQEFLAKNGGQKYEHQFEATPNTVGKIKTAVMDSGDKLVADILGIKMPEAHTATLRPDEEPPLGDAGYLDD